jgi:hypothetical protein
MSQISAPKGMVKHVVQTFPRYFRQQLVKRRGMRIKFMRFGLLWIEHAICSRATSAAAGGGVKIQVECF